MLYGAGMNIKSKKKRYKSSIIQYADTEIKYVYGCDGTLELRKIITKKRRFGVRGNYMREMLRYL